MKFSDAMLEGYKQVNGRQCRGVSNRIRGGKIVAHCAVGAAVAGGMSYGKAAFANIWLADHWGDTAVAFNDRDKLPWEHIYGMARAVGL